MAAMRARTGRKVAAVLAGGLVLGVGAAVTMAAWTDSQYATATFTSGTFALESSVDGNNWKNHTVNTPALISMGTSAMSPGTSGFGYLDVRTTKASTLGGKAVLLPATASAESDTGMIAALEMRAKVIGAGQICNDSALAGVPYQAATAEPNASGDLKLATGTAGIPVRFCLEVRMKTAGVPNSVQGKTAVLVWTVNGTSS